ncbi:MAG: transposase [Pseudorhodoplanes sp.]
MNQREYCEAHKIPLKAFGNWRARFKAQPQPPQRKLLYRRGGLSHDASHTLGHMTDAQPMAGPIVPPACEGYRRRFSETDKRRILAEMMRPGASLSAVARRYGIAARVLFHWKQERTASAAPMFVTVG